ncbi:hypothetical protein HAX54_039177, partial [Datura stramonium]|nr:hypothetical protein [Datura stramonium]
RTRRSFIETKRGERGEEATDLYGGGWRCGCVEEDEIEAVVGEISRWFLEHDGKQREIWLFSALEQGVVRRGSWRKNGEGTGGCEVFAALVREGRMVMVEGIVKAALWW